jgi:hypothetical protein
MTHSGVYTHWTENREATPCGESWWQQGRH